MESCLLPGCAVSLITQDISNAPSNFAPELHISQSRVADAACPHSGPISGGCDTIYPPITETLQTEGTQHDPRRRAQTAVQESLRAGDPRPGHLVGRGRRPDLPVVRAAAAGRLPAVGAALRGNGERGGRTPIVAHRRAPAPLR